MIELADFLEGLFEFLVVFEPAPHFRHEFAAQAELARAATGIGDGENGKRMAFTAGALLAIGLMAENGALDDRPTQDLAGDR